MPDGYGVDPQDLTRAAGDVPECLDPAAGTSLESISGNSDWYGNDELHQAFGECGVAAQLGETTDNRALVPGVPEMVHAAAQTLLDRGGAVEAVGNALGRVDTPSWFGAASNAFWDTFGPEKTNWFTAADALTSAAGTLSAYADTLSWAQGQAQDAIDLWAQGEAATAEARAVYQDTLTQYRNMGLPDSEPAPFTDPGEQVRQDAQAIVDGARSALPAAAGTAAAELRAESGGDGSAPDWPATAGDVARAAIDEFGLSVSQDSLEVERTREWSTGGDEEEQGDDRKGPDWSVALWEAGAEVSLWEVGAEGETRLGDVALAGNADARFLGASADANFSFGSDGLSLGGSAFAYLLQAGAEGSISYGITAEAWAGVGIAGDLDIGMEDGRFHIGGELGTALGVGGSVSPDITVDPGEVVDTAQDAADAVSDAAGNVTDWAQDAAGSVRGWW